MDKKKILVAKRKWVTLVKKLKNIQLSIQSGINQNKPIPCSTDQTQALKDEIYDAYQEYLRVLEEEKNEFEK